MSENPYGAALSSVRHIDRSRSVIMVLVITGLEGNPKCRPSVPACKVCGSATTHIHDNRIQRMHIWVSLPKIGLVRRMNAYDARSCHPSAD